MSFLKKGKESQKLEEHAQAVYEANKAMQGKPFRFWLPQGQSAFITFVDGELDEDGILMPPRFFEHNLKLNGEWGNLYVCPKHSNPELNLNCPICDTGNKPTLQSVFTIIDHRESVSKKDKTKVYKDQRRLLMVNPTVYETLYHQAKKRGGLAGAKFEVFRSNKDKSPSIGDTWDFEGKTPVEELKGIWLSKWVDKEGKEQVQDQFEPFDYEHSFNNYTPEELAKMPFLRGAVASGYDTSNTVETATVDYDNQL